MWAEPDEPEVVERMRTAHRQAVSALGVLLDQDVPGAWGWRGRTLSRPVIAPGGPGWLRVACAPAGHIVRTFWDGSLDAEQAIPASVPRPKLRASHDWSHDQWEYRAELYDRVAAHPVATSATLRTVPDLPATWWAALRTALEEIATVPTCRFTVCPQYLDGVMPRFLGTPIETTVPCWSTAHGDLHYANLCAPILRLLDWEGWGLAPRGYDAAVLHSHSLLLPRLAARVRSEFAPLFDTPTGRFAELVAITQTLHSTTRGNNLDLAEPLRNRAALLLGRPVPSLSQRGPDRNGRQVQSQKGAFREGCHR
ncbi:MAG TPA: hypothetical protein VFQ77_16765 [Pseudonocardiaceae bacterium]|jgi:hypothetical protein|nr:hypothetical protein [Pseudonocardiaceae bacterium]